MKNRFSFVICFLFLAQAQAASFDCDKATSRVEKLICSSPKISALDEDLNNSYKTVLSLSTHHGIILLRLDQKTWLKTTRDGCRDALCLENAYTSRIKELGKLNSAAGSEPCAYFINNFRGKPSSIKSDGEKFIGEICSDKYEPPVCSKPIIRKKDLAKLGFRLDDPDVVEILDAADTSTPGVSEVDIDNDGVPELRFYTSQGTLGCIENRYFKKTPTGSYVMMRHGEYDSFDRPEMICPGDFLYPKYNGIVYIINADPGGISSIWRGNSKGITEICSK